MFKVRDIYNMKQKHCSKDSMTFSIWIQPKRDSINVFEEWVRFRRITKIGDCGKISVIYLTFKKSIRQNFPHFLVNYLSAVLLE